MSSADNPFNNFYTPENSKFYAEYAYHPLDRETDDFRFLQILPGSSDDIVKCNLIPSSEGLKYEALSYRAGDPKQTREIMVDGHPFNVFSTLFGALVSLCDPSTSRIVWIDQICINQNDIVERNHQVRKMRTVYQMAERVVAWLGPLGDAEIGIDEVHRFYEIYVQREASFRKELALPTRILKPMEEQKIMRSISEDYAKEFALADQMSGNELLLKAKALGHLYNSEFWSRVWIWQEVIVARSVLLLWDKRSMDCVPFHVAGRIFAQLRNHEGDLPHLHATDLIFMPRGKRPTLYLLLTTLKRREDWRRNNILDFRDMLASSREAQSSDPRDKIYAISGLIREAYNIVPIYNDTIASVYCSTAWSIISVERSLNILADCDLPRTNYSNSLPTWCPDWSTGSSTIRSKLIFSSGSVQYTRFNACKRLGGSFAMEVQRSDDDKASYFVLIVDGLIIDHIEELGKHFQRLVNSTKAYNEILESWLSIVENKRTLNDELKAELNRTAVLDIHGYPDVREHRVSFTENLNWSLRRDVLEGHRRFFVTNKGLMGMAPHVAPGDIICVMPGTLVPILLRKVKTFYVLVGEVYVSDGYMEGRAFDEMERGEMSLSKFEIH